MPMQNLMILHLILIICQDFFLSNLDQIINTVNYDFAAKINVFAAVFSRLIFNDLAAIL